jgi:hypothetical protein
MDVPFKAGMIGGFDTQLAFEFFQGFANHALVTLHIDNLKGENAHHQCETVFKAFARALRMALRHEHLQRSNDPGLPGWDGVRVELKTFLGTRFRYRCVLPGGQRLEFDLELQAQQSAEGDLLSLRFEPGLARFFDAQTGWALT